MTGNADQREKPQFEVLETLMSIPIKTVREDGLVSAIVQRRVGTNRGGYPFRPQVAVKIDLGRRTVFLDPLMAAEVSRALSSVRVVEETEGVVEDERSIVDIARDKAAALQREFDLERARRSDNDMAEWAERNEAAGNKFSMDGERGQRRTRKTGKTERKRSRKQGRDAEDRQ